MSSQPQQTQQQPQFPTYHAFWEHMILHTDATSAEKAGDCPICYDPVEQREEAIARPLPCRGGQRHVICDDCFHRTFTEREPQSGSTNTNACPVCRERFYGFARGDAVRLHLERNGRQVSLHFEDMEQLAAFVNSGGVERFLATGRME